MPKSRQSVWESFSFMLRFEGRRAAIAALAGFLSLSLLDSVFGQSFKPELWSGMHYRMIGPDRGGRVTAIAGVPSQPFTFYMGSTGGGVWKTVDAGHNWTNISDGFFAVASMGALDVSLSDPNVVYAGTGSSKIRSNVSIGHGMYRSSDAGKTWTFAGLRDVGQIATVQIHPSDPNTVFVAAQGNPFIPNKDRGVFRTTDGGKTWKNVLHISEEAGAAALQLEPGNPKVIYACLWHAQRKPWTIISGATEGGIYKSTDGGDSWNKLQAGLPNQLFGRSNVAISASKPNRVYALIEAKPGSGLYRSEDAGATWSVVNASASLTTRPFYYSTLGVDPNNSDIVYVGDEGWFKSTDAGKSFQRAPVPHGDNHALWINPRNSDYMIQANDGGANISLDGGKTWSTQANQPTAEIYQVAVDNQYPYRVYGAQQDNTTVIVPSLPLSDGQDFRIGPGCETGPIIPNPADPNIVYGGCKGQMSRMNINTTDEERYWIGGQSLYGNPGSALIYRFQRVSPMEVSPYPPYAVYYASQYVHRSRDGGVTWERISPDLTAHPAGTQGASGEPITRDATGEEIYSTLYSIRESPVKKGVIWAGANDGPISVTQDDGKTWRNVTPQGLEPGGRVQNIEPSPHRAGTAYAAIYRYLLGDFQPYIYRTDDYGAHWIRLTDGTNGIAKDEPTRVVREDPDREGLLYAGTEFGIYISFDNGRNWQSFQMNLPVTPITDIKISHKDLVLSTQGRSFWLLDDLTPLHQLTETVATSKAFLFKPREAIRTVRRSAPEGAGGRVVSGLPQYPALGAEVDYYLAEAPSAELTLEVLDDKGEVVRRISSSPSSGGMRSTEGSAESDDEEDARPRSAPAVLSKSKGMHRFIWDLRYAGPWQSAKRPEGPNGPVAVPGKYQVRLGHGSWSSTQPLTIVEDPRITKAGVTSADLKEQFEQNLRVRQLVSDVNQTVARLKAAQAEAKKNLEESAKLAKLDELASHLVTPSIRYSKPELQSHITYLYTLTNATDQKIGRDAVERFQVLRKELDARIHELNAIIGPQ
jgi:photosystem II stability/assembly factor-like uncharacterized protein